MGRNIGESAGPRRYSDIGSPAAPLPASTKAAGSCAAAGHRRPHAAAAAAQASHGMQSARTRPKLVQRNRLHVQQWSRAREHGKVRCGPPPLHHSWRQADPHFLWQAEYRHSARLPYTCPCPSPAPHWVHDFQGARLGRHVFQKRLPRVLSSQHCLSHPAGAVGMQVGKRTLGHTTGGYAAARPVEACRETRQKVFISTARPAACGGRACIRGCAGCPLAPSPACATRPTACFGPAGKADHLEPLCSPRHGQQSNRTAWQ